MDTSHERIVPYDPSWVAIYQAESEKLKPIFGDSLVGIEHIGSTSVPELASKPIVDIAVLIKTHTEADAHIEPLAALGYTFDAKLHQNTVSPERHFFRKGSPTQLHLSIAYTNRAKFWPRQIMFRDWLRSHSADREQYETLKKQLMQEDPSGTNSYIGGKSDFIQGILQKAGFN
jgi:GrpB-like predicted nucleotidyltransferase (UPF0157 family)